MLVRKTNKIGLQIDVSERDFNQIPPPPKHQLKDPIVAKGSKNSQTSKNHPGTIRWLHDWTTLQRFKVILYLTVAWNFQPLRTLNFHQTQNLKPLSSQQFRVVSQKTWEFVLSAVQLHPVIFQYCRWLPVSKNTCFPRCFSSENPKIKRTPQHDPNPSTKLQKIPMQARKHVPFVVRMLEASTFG